MMGVCALSTGKSHKDTSDSGRPPSSAHTHRMRGKINRMHPERHKWVGKTEGDNVTVGRSVADIS